MHLAWRSRPYNTFLPPSSLSLLPTHIPPMNPLKTLLAVAATASLILVAAEARWPTLYRVGGGRSTWEPNANFTHWSSQHQFYVGDWLYFGFNKTLYDVLEVNRTGYERCSGAGFIANVTRGGRDVFNLTQAREYYFICSRGSYCSMEGMKVEVNVVAEPPMPPPVVTLPVHSSSGGASSSAATLFFVVCVLLSSAALFARI